MDIVRKRFVLELLLKGLIYSAKKKGDKPEAVANLEKRMLLVLEADKADLDFDVMKQANLEEKDFGEVFEGESLKLVNTCWKGVGLCIMHDNIERLKKFLQDRLGPEPVS